MTIDQSLQQAIIQHQSGQLEDAERLYLTILQIQPDHPEANNNMGVLAVQRKQPAASLPYFMAALDADPACGKYWLNYIDALFQAGQLEDARQILALAQQQGLQGEEVVALAARLKSDTLVAGQTITDDQQTIKESLPVLPPVIKNSKKNPRTKSGKSGSGKRTAAHQGNNPSPQEINALVALYGQGRLAETENLARKMTVRFPRHGAGWKVLGIVLNQTGRKAEALVPMKKAALLAQGDADAHNILGITLHDLGCFDEAEASYRRALQIRPNDAKAHANLGATLHSLGRLDEAETSYRRALKIKPDYAHVLKNLGAVLHDLGRLEEAETSYRLALEIKPDYADAHYNLGAILKSVGRLGDAEACYQRALQINPNHAEAHNNLGSILIEQGRLDEAEASYRRALQIKPDYAEAHGNLGNSLNKLGRMEEAEVSFRQALQIKPDYAEVHKNLGATLHHLGRSDEAEASFRRALQINPDYAEAYGNLGNTLNKLCRLDEAEACYRRALQIRPDYAIAHSNLLFCLTHNEKVDAETLFSEHCQFGEQYEAPFRAIQPQFTNSRDPERVLRIGFVSGDLYNHAVASFIEPLLEYLLRYPQLILHAYANQIDDDGVTQRLRGYFGHWHPIASLSDDALVEKIRTDGIDILIDLSGHTARNRLLVFAQKPAPVQASWIGYPGTTGLKAMDCYLADRFLLPPGQLDDQFTEKIVRLPANVPFLLSKDAPPVNILPALSNGYVTFGSFNRANKLSHAVITLWSQLLHALPDSRMVLGGMSEDEKYDTLIEWFTHEGITRDRLRFYPRSGMDAYLSLYQQIDICLDTFPYNGGTTTSHALWMGVPTLTLTGNTLPGRVGTAILSHMGLENFIARNKDDFVQKGVNWAGDLAMLSDVRARLRERFAQSAMGQPELIAAGLERALRIMWQRWCAGLPAESFEVSTHDLGNAIYKAGK